ncbi:MAG: hypothetical protein QXZ70_03750 [Candidatus Bathyarchaeia archaeon]
MPEDFPEKSNARKTVDKYTNAIIVFISEALFLSIVTFLPAAPFLPILIAAGLTVLSFRKPRLSNGIFCLLAFISIFWQINGFGIYSLFFSNRIGTLLLYTLLIIPIFMLKVKNVVAVPLASLSTALMLTPYYYLAIPLIGSVTFIAGLAAVSVLTISFVIYLLPFLIVENALYFSTPGSDLLPIVFDQLHNFMNELRPPLTSLNIFSSSLPPDYLSQRAGDVIAVLSGNQVLVMLIPIAIFEIVLVATVGLSALLEQLIRKLRVIEGFEKMPSWLPSFMVPIMLSASFFALIVGLSPSNIGSYKSPFINQNDAFMMFIGALIFGAIFTARENLIIFLERTEFARNKLLKIIEEGNRKIAISKATIDKVSSVAPSLDLSNEIKTIDSCQLLINDIKLNISTADYKTLIEWINKIQTAISNVNNIPDLLRIKLTTELNTLSILTSTYNASLEEVGLTEFFGSINLKIEETGIDQVITEYQKAIQNIRETISALYEKYVVVIQSYGKLTNTEVIMPTINPLAVIESNDILMALKLACDEYWLNFHTRRKDELREKIAKLLNSLNRLKTHVGIPEDQQYQQFIKFMEKALPSNSPEIIAQLKSLRFSLLNSVVQAKNENSKLTSHINTIIPAAMRIMEFESLSQSKNLRELYDNVSLDKNSIDELIEDIELISALLSNYQISKKRDTEKIIIFSQYSMVKRHIELTLKEKGRLATTELPFHKNVSLIYFRLYCASTPHVKYNDELEEIANA